MYHLYQNSVADQCGFCRKSRGNDAAQSNAAQSNDAQSNAADSNNNGRSPRASMPRVGESGRTANPNRRAAALSFGRGASRYTEGRAPRRKRGSRLPRRREPGRAGLASAMRSTPLRQDRPRFPRITVSEPPFEFRGPTIGNRAGDPRRISRAASRRRNSHLSCLYGGRYG